MLLGGGAGLLVAGTGSSFGLFYVSLDQIHEDIVGGQSGVPLQLEITIVTSLNCRPLKHAAVDIWHCNAAAIYSDISSENTAGQDRVWTQQHGSEAPLTIKKVGHRLTKGLGATVTLAVNPNATPALIGSTSPSG